MATYSNLDAFTRPRLSGVLRWKLGLGPEPVTKAPDRAEVPVVENDGAALKDASRPALTWIGHATFLVQLEGRSLLTDPILSPRITGAVPRNVPPGLSYDALPKIDLVTISHNHRDHMDAPTLLRLGPEVTYVVPVGLGSWFSRAGLRKVVELGWWEERSIEGLSITFVPSQHWSRRGLFDENKSLWGGWVIGGSGRRVYHSGDTAYFSGFKEIGKRLGRIDAAMLPIGAYDPRWFMKPQHMNPEDAVRAFVDLGAERFVAMHWGTFKLTDEPLDEPPRLVRELWARERLEPARLAIPAIGETLWL